MRQFLFSLLLNVTPPPPEQGRLSASKPHPFATMMMCVCSCMSVCGHECVCVCLCVCASMCARASVCAFACYMCKCLSAMTTTTASAWWLTQISRRSARLICEFDCGMLTSVKRKKKQKTNKQKKKTNLDLHFATVHSLDNFHVVGRKDTDLSSQFAFPPIILCFSSCQNFYLVTWKGQKKNHNCHNP